MIKKLLIALALILAGVKGCSVYVDGRVSSHDLADRQIIETSVGYQLSYLNLPAENKRPVILIHGSPGGAGNWSKFLSNHVNAFHWIAVDRPGFGGTRPKQAETSLEIQAEAIAAVLDRDWEKKPIILGYSLGGPVAAHLALNHGDKIAAVVFAAASMDPDLEEVWTLQKIGQLVHWLLPKGLRNANVELMALEKELELLKPDLPHIKVPVAFLHGERDENVPLENIAYLEGQLRVKPVLKYILPGLDHGIPWDGQHALFKLLKDLDALLSP